ncbi:MFS transporter [Celerinatantimonas sp. YJH-8]|uniref:MFS transporter n=1 Tax=Celerinatantimonas sp. YJH-8 TaxID=3228714 RepID=UPI0038CC0045
MMDITSKKKRYWIFSLLYLGWCIAFIDRVVLSMSSTHIANDLSLNSTEIGLIMSAFYLGFWLMQFPGGWLADRYGAKIIVMVCIGCWSVFTFTTGIAWSLVSLLVIRFLFGIGEGGYPSASIKNAAEHFPIEQKPKISSFLISSNYIGSMLAPMLIAPLVIYLGWRHAFMSIGVLGIIFVILYGLTVPNKKSLSQSGKQYGFNDVKSVLSNKVLWGLAATWFGLSLVNKGLDSWMPVYLMTERHLDIKHVGMVLPFPYIFAGVATAIGGWVMLKFFDGREKYMLMVCALLTAFFIFLMYRASTITEVIIAQSLAYFFKSFVLAVAVALPTKMMPGHQVGSAIGVINVGGQAAGFIAPLTIGIIIDHFNFSSAFLFLMGAALFAAVMSLTIHTKKLKKEVTYVDQSA